MEPWPGPGPGRPSGDVASVNPLKLQRPHPPTSAATVTGTAPPRAMDASAPGPPATYGGKIRPAGRRRSALRARGHPGVPPLKKIFESESPGPGRPPHCGSVSALLLCPCFLSCFNARTRATRDRDRRGAPPVRRRTARRVLSESRCFLALEVAYSARWVERSHRWGRCM